MHNPESVSTSTIYQFTQVTRMPNINNLQNIYRIDDNKFAEMVQHSGCVAALWTKVLES